jgi:hypothetical protein
VIFVGIAQNGNGGSLAVARQTGELFAVKGMSYGNVIALV